MKRISGNVRVLSDLQNLISTNSKFISTTNYQYKNDEDSGSFWTRLFSELENEDDDFGELLDLLEEEDSILNTTDPEPTNSTGDECYVFPVKSPVSSFDDTYLYFEEETKQEESILRNLKRTEGEVIVLSYSPSLIHFQVNNEKNPFPSTFGDVSKFAVAGIVTEISPSFNYGETLVVFNPIESVEIVEEDEKVLLRDYKLSVRPRVLDKPEENEETEAYTIMLIESLEELMDMEDDVILNHKLRDVIPEIKIMRESGSENFYEYALDNAIFSVLSHRRPNSKRIHELLSIPSLIDRLKETVQEIKKEVETLKIKRKINVELEEELGVQQREYYLREQYKIIGEELGITSSSAQVLINKYEEKLEGKIIPQEVQEVYNDELDRLLNLDSTSHEYHVIRDYLDWLTAMPYSLEDSENRDFDIAEEQLDNEHYGLDDVKERILEFISVGILKGSSLGKILCFVGPPGTGKTSIGESIAKALGRRFFRFSVGGMSDVFEIKGHRRTYIGALPGKLVSILKRAESSNPVILIDEIDKIAARSHHGDPASALLEVLDPEQNANFLDHYLDVPIDLSKVLFICTANSTATIPRPLLDRFEVLNLNGYIIDEKIEIAKRHVFPKLVESMGMEKGSVEISDEVLQLIIRGYCREAGIRGLEKTLEKILRKIAMDVVRNGTKKTVVDMESLTDYLGPRIFIKDKLYDQLPVGASCGLAYNSLGGTHTYFEVTALPKRGQEDKIDGKLLKITGSLGEVMKESIEIAYSQAQVFLNEIDPENNFFKENDIHLHCPEGATPKDGPSAGITISCALLSAATGKPLRPNLGMTGELTLNGKVLRIGGVREKLVGAKSIELTDVILPRENESSLDNLNEQLLKDLNFHFVDNFKEVFEVAFDY